VLAWFQNRDLKQFPFALVLLIELAGVVSVILAPQHWLRAVGVLTLGMAVGGLLRLVLSDEQAGLLRVRRRTFDVASYWGLGGMAMLVALALPQR
jgi:hypothetical protein